MTYITRYHRLAAHLIISIENKSRMPIKLLQIFHLLLMTGIGLDDLRVGFHPISAGNLVPHHAPWTCNVLSGDVMTNIGCRYRTR